GRQRRCERKHLVVLHLVAERSPPRVIPILFAASRITATRLQMSTRGAANPHVFPCRWNRQAGNAVEFRATPDHTTTVVDILEAASPTPAKDAGSSITHVDKPG